MRNSKSQIEKQYSKYGTKADLFKDICAILEEQGVDLNKVSRYHISGMDEFHVRGAEVSNEMVKDLP